jgi:hypothetical protein
MIKNCKLGTRLVGKLANTIDLLVADRQVHVSIILYLFKIRFDMTSFISFSLLIN